MTHGFKDPVSAWTHLVGALLSAAGMVVLMIQSAQRGTVWGLVSGAIFGISMILLYTASTVYHAVRATGRRALALRKLDHIMIYFLIAGTYTPFCLGPLRGPWGWSLLAAIWGLALGGLALTFLWWEAPRWLTTALYVLMGWLVIVAAYPIVQLSSAGTLVWLVVGGLFYTVGAVLYATKWPRLWPPVFGFHELWHLFVMAGTISHFLAVYGLS